MKICITRLLLPCIWIALQCCHAQTAGSQVSREETVKYIVDHLSEYDSLEGYRTRNKCGTDPYVFSFKNGSRTLVIDSLSAKTCTWFEYDIDILAVSKETPIGWLFDENPNSSLIVILCEDKQTCSRGRSLANGGIGCLHLPCSSPGGDWVPDGTFRARVVGPEKGVAGPRLVKAFEHLIELARADLNSKPEAYDPFAH